MTTKNFLAIDLGAESGRAVVGRFDGEKLTLEEAHRFANGPTRLGGSLHWNVLGLFNEIKQGVAKVVREQGLQLSAMGLDTWGVDFGLLDRQGNLIGNPYHYRDARTDGMIEAASEIMSREEIFRQTGIAFMQLNTLFQLFAMVKQQSPTLDIASRLLMIPDLLNYWLTGRAVSEYTIASTSQCYNMAERRWALPMLEKLGIPTYLFEEVVQPGTDLGRLLPAIGQELGFDDEIAVIAVGSHDTASAVAAVPVATDHSQHFAYISSGTWSLVGTEIPDPIITEAARAANVTNEGGVMNTIRLLKNLGGLWLVQESRRTWAREGADHDYDELTHMAAAAEPFAALIDPDDGLFLAPGDMPGRIAAFCQRTNQTAPASKGGIIRTALESLALKYRWTIERIEALIDHPIEVVHIVGGGTQNRLLNQFTADATGRPVITGPIEATAIGNILMQMLATGELSSLAEGRDLVRRSFEVETYEPKNIAAWREAYARLEALL